MNLSIDFLDECINGIGDKGKYKLLQNVLTNVHLGDLEKKISVNENLTFEFNNEIKKSPSITNQKSAGVCWIHAGLNMIRHALIKKYKLSNDFELSYSFVSRYHKLEMCNFMLELIYEKKKEHGSDFINSINYKYLVSDNHILGDGGTWNCLKCIIKKYGIVPKSAYPSTMNIKNTKFLNFVLFTYLKKCLGCMLLKENFTDSDFYQLKNKVMFNCYKIIDMCQGYVPNTFEWNDIKNYDPKSFYKLIVKPVFNLNRYVVISNHATYDDNMKLRVQYGNIIIDEKCKKLETMFADYINLSLDDFKDAIAQSITKYSTPVFFGCDYDSYIYKQYSVLNQKLSLFDELFDIDLGFSKKDGLMTYNINIDHAMIFTGYHQKDDKIIRWKVNNSHGVRGLYSGSLLMSDDWFNNYVISAVVHRKCLKQKKFKKTKTLSFWDPLNNLA